MALIDSIKDDRISMARALATRAGRVSAGRCLIMGASLIGQVAEALHETGRRSTAGARLDYVLCPQGADESELAGRLATAGVAVHPVRDGLLRKITGPARPAGWVAVALLPPETDADVPYGDFAVVCEQVADPGNLGTIVRTARALGVADLVLTDTDADLTSPRVLEAARGAVLSCRVRRFPDPGTALASLRRHGFQIVVTSPHGSHLQALAPVRERRLALVVGNETAGVSAATTAAADLVVRIPMAGPVESLNVGVAAGISIYERRTPLGQLGRDVGVGGTELAGLLAPLDQRGYLTLAAEHAEITREGKQAVAALWALQEQAEEDLLDGFSQAERDQLRDMLHRIQANAVRGSAANSGTADVDGGGGGAEGGGRMA